MSLTFEIEYLPVLVAALVSMVVGSLWYAPFVFGKRWMAYLGLTQQELREKGNPSVSMAVAVVGSLVANYALAVVIRSIGTTDVAEGLIVGLLVGVGMLGVWQFVGGRFECRNWGFDVLNAAQNAVTYAANGMILAAWTGAPF